jgi:hypothetical protein
VSRFRLRGPLVLDASAGTLAEADVDIDRFFDTAVRGADRASADRARVPRWMPRMTPWRNA